MVLPDTQHYSEAFPAIFTAQTQWIVDNRDARNIVFVTHEGDIVENNDPSGVAAGQHQHEPAGRRRSRSASAPAITISRRRSTTSTFPYTRYPGTAVLRRALSGQERQQLPALLRRRDGFCHRPPRVLSALGAVTWADVRHGRAPGPHRHPDDARVPERDGAAHGVRLREHSYLWDQLAVPSPNLRFMLSGHVHDESRRTDTVGGRTGLPDAGRLSGPGKRRRRLAADPALRAGRRPVYVQTYSPWLNAYETDANSQFTLDFPMGGAFEDAGAVTAPSGSDAAVPPTGLDPDTSYEWQMTVTNGSGRSRTGPRWTFTTGAGGSVNQPPSATAQSVTVSEDGSAFVTLGGSDPEGNPLSYAVVSGPAHGTLSGVAPALAYQPAANYSGSDSFTFRVNDGQHDSPVATVAITVQAVNDPPRRGRILHGAVGRDAHCRCAGAPQQRHGHRQCRADGGPQFRTGPRRVDAERQWGILLCADIGLLRARCLLIRRHRRGLSSAPATVNLTVTAPPPPPPPAPLISANFNTNADSFTYADDRFRGTTQSSYASGARSRAGASPAARCKSRGWRQQTDRCRDVRRVDADVTLSAPATLTLTFRYNMNAGPDYESETEPGARQPRRHAQGCLAQRLRGAGHGQRQRWRRDRDRLAARDDPARHAAVRDAHAHGGWLQQQEGRQVRVDDDSDRRRHGRTAAVIPSVAGGSAYAEPA